MKIICAIAISAAALSACAPTGPTEVPGAPYNLSSKEIKAIQSGVRSSLKDPDSARFAGVYGAAKSATGTVTVCGLVNAKNSFGGYTGDHLFIGQLDSLAGIPVFGVTGMANDKSSTGFYSMMCKNKGVSF